LPAGPQDDRPPGTDSTPSVLRSRRPLKGTGKPSSRQTPTRDRLLREARRVFERLGYHATRVDDIVAAAGLAHGTFYRYFGSKEEAFQAVAAEALREIGAGQPLTAPTAYAPDVIEYGMRTYLAEFRKDARMIELLEEAATYDPEVRHARLDLRERMSKTTAEFIGALLARAEIGEDLDVEYVSALIGAMVDRFAYTWFVFGRDFDEERAVKQLRDAYLRMIGWHERPPRRNGRLIPINDIPLRGPSVPVGSPDSH
jgi:AcrR family transcriptional regulator